MKLNLTRRETILIIIFIVVASGMGYFYLRFRPVSKKIKQVKGANTSNQKKLKSFKLAKEPRTNNDRLKSQLKQLEEEVEQGKNKIRNLEKQFASLDSLESLQQLKVEISSLARLSGVLITENIPYDSNRSAGAGFRRPSKAMSAMEPNSMNLLMVLKMNKEFTRPLRKITVRTSFYDLLSFIRGLKELSWNVTIAQFALETLEQPEARQGPQLIEAKLVLAL